MHNCDIINEGRLIHLLWESTLKISRATLVGLIHMEGLIIEVLFEFIIPRIHYQASSRVLRQSPKNILPEELFWVQIWGNYNQHLLFSAL